VSDRRPFRERYPISAPALEATYHFSKGQLLMNLILAVVAIPVSVYYGLIPWFQLGATIKVLAIVYVGLLLISAVSNFVKAPLRLLADNKVQVAQLQEQITQLEQRLAFALLPKNDADELQGAQEPYRIEVLIPSAFVRPVGDNRSVCMVFLQVELQNPTPNRPNLVKYFLDFKAEGKDVVRISKMLDLRDFQACNTIESTDEDSGETWLTFTDYEDMEDLRSFIINNGPPEDGFPAIGWLGFIVRKSVLPYDSYEQGLGYGRPILTDEGEPTGDEEEETETVYFPKFSAIEELKLIVVDGHRQSWSGTATAINPRGEAVIPRPSDSAG
jgi:hypothetical protein